MGYSKHVEDVAEAIRMSDLAKKNRKYARQWIKLKLRYVRIDIELLEEDIEERKEEQMEKRLNYQEVIVEREGTLRLADKINEEPLEEIARVCQEFEKTLQKLMEKIKE